MKARDCLNMMTNVSYPKPRRLHILRCALLWSIALWAAAPAQAQSTVAVDLNIKYQTFEGWGTSLAWWANVVGGYPDANRNDYIDKFFDPVHGLGLNIARYNIGGGENPQHLPPNNTYLPYRTRVPGFLASPSASYDWTQDANQRWVLQQTMLKGVNIAEAFSNSAPYWMTNSGSVTGAQNGGNNLNPSYVSAFADYLTSVVQHYHDTWGITFRTIEPFNEPSSNWWKLGGNQEGCGIDRATQNALAKILSASLASKHMSYTTVSASDENSIDEAVLSLFAMDSKALADLGQVNTHSYNGRERTKLLSAATMANKRLWMSEYGDGDATGMTTAERIVNDLKVMQSTSWIYWQVVDNAGGWGFVNNALDGSTNYGYTVNQKYYVMGNFTEFIRPGYQFADINDANSVAAYDGNGTLVIVTVSNSITDKEVKYAFPGFGDGPWTVTAHRTSGSENLVAQSPFTVSTAAFARLIPAHSVTTFVITNSKAAPIVDGGAYYVYNMWSGNVSGTANNQQLLDEGGWNKTVGKQLDAWGNSYNAETNTWPANQVWVAHSARGSNWVFTNLNSGLAVDIAGAAAGTAVVQNNVTDNTSQVWTVVPVGDGSFKLANAQTGLFLEMTDWWGKGVVQDVNHGWKNQDWAFVPYQGSTYTTELTMSTYTSPTLTTSSEQLAATIASSSPNAPTGTVTFYDGSTVIGKITNWGSDRAVNFNAGNLTEGTHYISAVYSGDTHNATSSTPEIAIVVQKQATHAASTSLTNLINTAR